MELTKKEIEQKIAACDLILDVMDYDSKVPLNINDLIAGKDNEILQAIRTLDLTVAANGVIFKKATGFLPKIMEELYAKRKGVKNQMLSVDSEIELIKAELDKRSIKL